ncbi:hypothetical protein GUJ93_ZPchr0010g7293 [Zizania palustris]|uniref:Uncharacterized protein n=1 Tax=Zizania palustris TaxID=103762 RepID=A0A8J5WDQ4_ZIZPA|nr:hypothetical protein GUJ93_ZPchr0010g7293 [Zizania palustris]
MQPDSPGSYVNDLHKMKAVAVGSGLDYLVERRGESGEKRASTWEEASCAPPAKVGIASGAAAAAGGRFRHAAPVFATAAGAESAAAAAPLVSAGGEVPVVAAPGAQWSSWEMDDWEFADWRDVAVAEPEETVAGKPRLVFAPPSMEEAEEATSDLRDAIERVYFSEAPVEVVKEDDKDLSKQGVDAIIPAMPGHVMQAFTLLKSSPEAQGVVASLASDKNVWEAVSRNEKVMEFCKTQQQTLMHTFPEGNFRLQETSDKKYIEADVSTGAAGKEGGAALPRPASSRAVAAEGGERGASPRRISRSEEPPRQFPPQGFAVLVTEMSVESPGGASKR